MMLLEKTYYTKSTQKNKMLGMIWDILYFEHLYDKYDKSYMSCLVFSW